MTPERWNSGTTRGRIARQWHNKHVSVATNTPTTTEELQEEIFSVRSVPGLYNEDQWEKLVSRESEVTVGCENRTRRISTVRSHCQAIASKERTNQEHLVCATVFCRACKLVSVMVICSCES
jgi:hypothetical protein